MINKYNDSTYDGEENIEINYSGTTMSKFGDYPPQINTFQTLPKGEYNEASYHPKGKCPMGFGSKLDSKKEHIDWHAKYMELQKDLAEESIRWNKRFKDLELAYNEKIDRIQLENQKTLEDGYEEALEMIMEQRKKFATLENELYNTQNKVNEPGM